MLRNIKECGMSFFLNWRQNTIVKSTSCEAWPHVNFEIIQAVYFNLFEASPISSGKLVLLLCLSHGILSIKYIEYKVLGLAP